MRKVELLRIVVASPGDVQSERDCVEATATELNRGLADVQDVRLDVVRWETDSFPGFNQAGSQEQIDTALSIDNSDLVLVSPCISFNASCLGGILFCRNRQPTAAHGSGRHALEK